MLISFSVYIPVNVTRESLRQTIEFKLKVADRKANPMLNFVMWNIRVTQLECTRGAPGIISGKLLNDSSSTPMARTLNNDIDLLGEFVSRYKLYNSQIHCVLFVH